MKELDYIPPKNIFKFVSAETLFNILSNSSLKFSPPNGFNDPYDCYLGLVSFESNPFAIEGVKNDPTIDEEKKAIMLRDMTVEPIALSQVMNDSTDRILSNSGITCFSLKKNSMLMWSHYAEKHAGACIEFQSIPLIRSIAAKGKKVNVNEVNYTAEFDVVNFHESPVDAINRLIFTKSDDWSYEEEFRILIEGNGLVSFDTNSICSVTFGSKTASSIVEQSMLLLQRKKVHPKLFKAKLAAKEFRLLFEELKW